MFRGFFTRYRVYYCAHIPGLTKINVFDKPDPVKPTEPKNGVERVVALFQTDERGELKKEVVSSIQITISSGLFLAFYGGTRHSKGAFENWITINSTNRFRTAYQAKRALHDYIALEFAKHFLVYGFKGAVFTGILMFTLITVAAYRDKNGVLEYSIAGLLAGSLMRITYGLRGMISGAVVGSGLSTLVGLIVNLFLKLSSLTVDDVRKWQYDIRTARKDAMREWESKQDEDKLSLSLKHYTSRLTQPSSTEEDDEEKVFVVVNSENESVTNHDIPTS